LYDAVPPLVLRAPTRITTIIRVHFHVDLGYCTVA